MAEKRGHDRVILKACDVYGDIYSEEENPEEFSRENSDNEQGYSQISKDNQYDGFMFEIKNIEWSYDIPGFITTKDLMDIINLKFIIFKNKFLNSLKVKIDANNYYIQSGDMREISEISKYLI